MALLVRGKTVCKLRRNVISGQDSAIAFPHFVVNENDVLFEFSDAAFHEACVLKHPHGGEAVGRADEWVSRTGPGKRTCCVCGKEIRDPDDYILIEHLTAEEDSPLHRYNYTHIHRSCVDSWIDRSRFLDLLSELEASGEWSGPYLNQIKKLFAK